MKYGKNAFGDYYSIIGDIPENARYDIDPEDIGDYYIMGYMGDEEIRLYKNWMDIGYFMLEGYYRPAEAELIHKYRKRYHSKKSLEYYYKNKDVVKEKTKKYREKNRDKLRERLKEYRKKHKTLCSCGANIDYHYSKSKAHLDSKKHKLLIA